MPVAALEQTIFVGKKNNPRYFIKRSEIKGYLDKEFYDQYKIWKMYHLKLGLPRGLSWDLQPLHIIDIIETFEDEYIYMRQGQ